VENLPPNRPALDLSPEAFTLFLRALDPDPEVAGMRYETLRQKLMRFFERRGLNNSDDAADAVIDRTIKRMSSGEKIENTIEAYALGVARMYALELVTRGPKGVSIDDEDFGVELVAENASNLEAEKGWLLQHLDACLEKLSHADRLLLIDYFHVDEGETAIEHRQKIAERLGLSMNALRIKINRLKGRVEKYLEERMRVAKPEMV